MQLIGGTRGVSLVELMIAVAMVTSVVAVLSLTFPKTARHAANTQRRTLATNLAQSQLQTIKSSPYAFLDVTDPVKLDASCNCTGLADLTVLPSSGTTMAGTTFNTASCIHFVTPGAPWNSQCAGDTGYKHIVVYVYWTNGGETYSTSQESMITRF